MIPNYQPLYAHFTDGTATPVAAFNTKGRALIANASGDLVLAAQAPGFNKISTKREN
jgi:hypothetical protein